MAESNQTQQQNANELQGVQKTEVRFNEKAQRRLLREQLLSNPSKKNRTKKRDPNQNNDGSPNPNRAQAIKQREEAIRKIALEEGGIDISDEEMTGMMNGEAQHPPFPYIIVFIAFIKDFMDFVFTISFLLFFLAPLTTLPIALVLFFWVMGKMSGGWWKKRLIAYTWKRFILTIVIKFIPFFSIIPATTIFVLMVHYRETAVIEMFNGILETIHKKGIPLK